MKWLLMVFLVALSGFACAIEESDSKTEVDKLSETMIKHFGELPDREAFDFWRNNREPIAASEEMINLALAGKRHVFLQLVFGDCDGFYNIIHAVDRMPDFHQKHRWVISMLGWDSDRFWRNDQLQKEADPLAADLSAGSGLPRPNAIEPFVGVIRKLLPKVDINESLFDNKPARLKLAAELESAMANDGSNLQTIRPKKRPHNGVLSQSDTPQVELKGKSGTIFKYTDWSMKSGLNIFLLLGSILVAFISICWIIFRKTQ